MTQSLPVRFAAFVREHRMFDVHTRLYVAASGGLDSSVLCRLLHNAGFPFAVVHCHFGLRESESDRDAAFVQETATAYNTPFFLRRFQTAAFAAAEKMSIQEAARKLRYDWFAHLVTGAPMVYAEWSEDVTSRQIAADTLKNAVGSPVRLLTAHHLDDNVETMLMNFFKGTGISGLRGMLPVQAHVVRPLLFARRAELEAFAAANNIGWVEDSSNAATKYTRNFFRHEVLPLVGQKFPQTAETLASNLTRFAEAEILYRQAIDLHRKNLLEHRGSEVWIPVRKLSKVKPLHTVAYELLKPFGFSAAQMPTVLQLLESESGRYVQSATHQIVRHRLWLVVAPLQASDVTMLVIEADRDTIRFGNKQLQWLAKPVPTNLSSSSSIAVLDSKLLQFPLVLRRWQAGDYFYPLGMRKKKKVSRLLIDLKLSKTEKEQIWVLESGKKIVWVVGLRIDDRFKVTDATAQVVQFTLQPND